MHQFGYDLNKTSFYKHGINNHNTMFLQHEKLFFMKILKIIAFLLVANKFTAYSQQDSALKRVPVAQLTKLGAGNFYVYNDNLNKFVGTWVGRDNQRSVKIVFIKKGIRLSNNRITSLK